MSLLMDALRKAEQQKQAGEAQGQQSRQDAVPAQLAPQPHLEPHLELEPLSAQAKPAETGAADGAVKAGANQLPELPTRLEDLDEQFISSAAKIPPTERKTVAARATESATAPRGNNVEASREAARAVFSAKHPAKPEKRNFAIAVGLLTLAATVGIGGYFWWQMGQMRQPQGGLVASRAAKPPPLSATVPPVSPVAAPAPVAVVAAPASGVPLVGGMPTSAVPTVGGVPAGAVPPAPTLMAPHARNPGSLPPTGGRTSAWDGPAPTSTTPAAAKSPVPPPQSLIRVTAAPQKTNPWLEQAYDAFNRGEINRAEAAWQKVLEADPRNADALYGMAAIAQQRQQPNLAADFYLRALEANPRDALALAGLISLKGYADPQQTISRLKVLLAEQPDSPFLNFAIGNVYARDARWTDAQQAYFKAHVADPGNPDYLFNLAVSLDQLHQPRLAGQYYHRALDAAARRPAGFDTTQVMSRLKILQP